MQSFILLNLLVLTFAIPTPQLIDTEGGEAAPDPVFFLRQLTMSLSKLELSISPRLLHEINLLREMAIVPHSLLEVGLCRRQILLMLFVSNSVYSDLANNAKIPDGYSRVMKNGGGFLSASNYMGLRTLKSYDTLGCASLCDQASGCEEFNVYIERDPSLDLNKYSCPDPSSVTNYECTLWSAAVSAAEATSKGQWRDSFQVMIAGSNAYNKATPPPAIACYTGPVELGCAINDPLNAQGQNTYMGYKYHPFSQSQGYDPSTCAADCN